MMRIEHLKKQYGDNLVLNDISLSLDDEVTCILGPSGAGKSTFLRCLNLLESPTGGDIKYNGQSILQPGYDIRKMREEVTMVFQHFNLFPLRNVVGNVMLALQSVKHMKKADAHDIAMEMLKKVDMADKAEKMPDMLSGGQQQRVAIARALVTEPAIICLDEPLSNLDAKLRVQLRMELKKMQKDFGITSIYVTHDQEEALTLSDRIAVFNKGVIEQIGTPNEIYNHSATEFVCNFIGDINRLSDDIVEKLNATGAQLDPTHHHYIRLERVHVNDAQHAESGAVSLSGAVESREYYGLYIKYYINVGSQTLKVIERNDGVHLHDTGDAVTVTVHPDDLMSYAPNGEEAGK